MGKPTNIASLIAGAAKKPAKAKKKNANPVISLPQHEKAIETWLKQHGIKKDADSKMKEVELEFLEDVEDARKDACQRDGKYYSSVKVEAEKGKISVSVQNRYSPIDPANYPQLEEVFGDKTEGLFVTKTEIALTEVALSDEKMLEKLVAAVGQENFERYFDVKQIVVPTQVLHESRATDKDVAEKANQLIDAGILAPYKAAIKIA